MKRKGIESIVTAIGNLISMIFSQYLEFKKCNRVPRFLGDDENNREILSFLHEYVSGNNFLNCHAIVWTDYIVTMMLVIRLIRMEQ